MEDDGMDREEKKRWREKFPADYFMMVDDHDRFEFLFEENNSLKKRIEVLESALIVSCKTVGRNLPGKFGKQT